jgi:3',5'-cyclic AMP phosphodiesterase CpdA
MRVARQVTVETDGVVIARLRRPVSESPTRLAVVSDAHVATRAEGTDKMFHTTEDRLRAAVRRLNSAEPSPDLVLFNGDLTKDGEPWNFGRFDAIVDDLEAPFVAAPGNHDVPKEFDDHETPSLSAFEERYAPEPFPFVRRVGGVAVVVLDTATFPDGSLADGHRGALSPTQLGWLDETLGRLEDPVVALHHNVTPVLPRTVGNLALRRAYSLYNRAEVVELLNEHEVPVVLTAHHHIPDVERVGGFTEVTAPPACAYPQAHLLLDVDKSGTTVRLVPHADKDEQREAYDAFSSASNARRRFAGITAGKLRGAPLLEDPPRRPKAELRD